ncbi:MAG: class I SAM-dependent methyltransferase [Bradymonadia bacterium]
MKQTLKKIYHTTQSTRRWTSERYWKSKVEPVLRAGGTPDTSRAEADFEQLTRQGSELLHLDYGYGARDTWHRAVTRVEQLIDLPGLAEPTKKVLEACCGDGSVGAALRMYGHDVHLSDMNDWRHARAKDLPFTEGCLEDGLPLETASMDAAFSYNAFEHVDDPRASLEELARVVKPGGVIYLSFGPLYASPWGMHAYRTIPVPFLQHIFSEPFTLKKLKEVGIDDLGSKLDELQPMNRWTVSQFDNLWRSAKGLKIEGLSWMRSDLKTVPVLLAYPESFRGRGLVWEDIAYSGCVVTLRRTR